MVIAYWLIGREIVEELPRGDERAEYGRRVGRVLRTIDSALRSQFSVTYLKCFRLFFQAYSDRLPVIADEVRLANTKEKS